MKKLIFTLAVGCAASLVHAAAANWSASASEILNGSGTETYATGTALFFDAGVMSQAALYSLFNAGSTIDSTTSGYLTEKAISSGSLNSVNFANGEQGDGKTYNYFFAIVQDDQIYLSNIVGDTPNGSSSAKPIGFGEQYDYDQGNPPNSYAPATEGYEGAGRWAAKTGSEPIPEPTSGLLVLLGLAGLMLKRKRI